MFAGGILASKSASPLSPPGVETPGSKLKSVETNWEKSELF
jgi:hypothetical protein